MKTYELQVGVYIEAVSEEEAWEKFSPVVELANSVDAEGTAFAEIVGSFGDDGLPDKLTLEQAAEAMEA